MNSYGSNLTTCTVRCQQLIYLREMNRVIAISLGTIVACFGIASAQTEEVRRDSVGMAVPMLMPADIPLGTLPTFDSSRGFGRIDSKPSIGFEPGIHNLWNPNQGSSSGAWSTSVSGLTIAGGHSYNDHLSLLSTRSASLGLNYSHGGLTAYVGASATTLTPLGFDTVNQFGVDAMVSYRFSPVVSMTVFGQYYSNAPYFNAATYAYINSSRYGAYATFESRRFGVDLGAQRYLDPTTGQWKIAPVVTPFIKIGKGFSIKIPVGELIQSAIDKPNRMDVPPPARPKSPAGKH